MRNILCSMFQDQYLSLLLKTEEVLSCVAWSGRGGTIFIVALHPGQLCVLQKVCLTAWCQVATENGNQPKKEPGDPRYLAYYRGKAGEVGLNHVSPWPLAAGQFVVSFGGNKFIFEKTRLCLCPTRRHTWIRAALNQSQYIIFYIISIPS